MSKRGFTLMELLIVVAIIGIIGTLVIVFLNPLSQLGKAQDTKRKKDLNLLRKAIEEWYNDKGCYPKPEEICYSEPQNVCENTPSGGSIISQMCNICGNENDSPDFLPYLQRLPCDPLHPKYTYVYEVEAQPGFSCGSIDNTTHICASWYRVYSSLFDREDKDSMAVGCAGDGCGFAKRQLENPAITSFPDGYGFNYGVSSSNTALSSAKKWYCQTAEETCGRCGNSYNECMASGDCEEYGYVIYPGVTAQNCQDHI